MAVWQFKLNVIPRISALRNDVLVKYLNPDDLLAQQVWSGIKLDFSELDSLYPKIKSWSSEVHIWGNNDGSNIVVTTTGNKLEWITASVDTRQTHFVEVNQLVALAIKLNCVFLLDSGEVLDADCEKLFKKLDNSLALNYVRDPEKALKKLKDKSELQRK